MNPTNGGWLIFLTLVVALILSIFHLPEGAPAWLAWLRPVWVSLILFYWVIELPHRVGLISAWILGFVVDVAVGDPLGLNGLLLAFITYVTWRFYERLRMLPVLQQGATLFVLVLVGELTRAIVVAISGSGEFSLAVVIPALSSFFTWPFIYLLLERVRRQVLVR